MQRRALAAIAAGLLGVAGCSQDPTESEVYLQAAAELEQSGSDLAAARAEVDELTGELEQAQTALAELEDERDAALSERDDAQATVEELLLRYDEQIRSDLQAAYDAEVERACERASADPRSSVSSITHFERDWTALGVNSAQLDETVEACAAPAREAASLTREEAGQALAGHVEATVAGLRGQDDAATAAVEGVATAAAELIATSLFVEPDAGWVAELERLADLDCGAGGCYSSAAVGLLEAFQVIGVPGAPAIMFSGDRVVGAGADEAAPGTWVAYDVDGCYWERLDADGEIIDNNFVSGAPQVRVTIRESDFAFNSSDCAPWLKF